MQISLQKKSFRNFTTSVSVDPSKDDDRPVHNLWCPSEKTSKVENLWCSADLINLNHVLRFPAGSHNETWACSDYYQTITYFLDEVNSCKYCQVLSNNCQVLYLNRESGRARAASPSTLVSHSTVLTVWWSNCSHQPPTIIQPCADILLSPCKMWRTPNPTSAHQRVM